MRILILNHLVLSWYLFAVRWIKIRVENWMRLAEVATLEPLGDREAKSVLCIVMYCYVPLIGKGQKVLLYNKWLFFQKIL